MTRGHRVTNGTVSPRGRRSIYRRHATVDILMYPPPAVQSSAPPSGTAVVYTRRLCTYLHMFRIDSYHTYSCLQPVPWTRAQASCTAHHRGSRKPDNIHAVDEDDAHCGWDKLKVDDMEHGPNLYRRDLQGNQKH
eukprot:scaffold7379_cov366-Prasinococcus_capsulatus_cf.AAC.10